MNFNYILGIDISKLTLDCTLVHNGKKVFHQVIQNKKTDIKRMVSKLIKLSINSDDNIVFVMEYTGIYNSHVIDILEETNMAIWQCSAIHIIRSMGLQRGKNDKIDSYRIAMFAYRNIDQYKPHVPVRQELKDIKRLFAVRRNLVKSRKQIDALTKDYDFMNPNLVKTEKFSVQKTLDTLDLQIQTVEDEMRYRILNDRTMSRQFMIITSIKGLGFVTAAKLIIVTNEFLKITNPRALACHAGVAPFEHSSGSSIKKSTRVSAMADKEMKKLLHMAAIAAISHPGELREYYMKKVEQGKHKMTAINNVRNKLIHRVYSCINGDRIYKNNLHMDLI